MLLHFAKFLLQSPKIKSPELLATYNYIKYFESHGEALDPYFFIRIKKKLLSFKFWQTNQNSLRNFWLKALQDFKQNHHLDYSPEELIGKTWQIVDLKNSRDQFDCLKINLQGSNPFKILITPSRSFTIERIKERIIRVNTYTNSFYIHEGKLKPLQEISSLSYDFNLNLLPDIKNVLEIENNNFLQVSYCQQKYSIIYLRGYCLQKFKEFQISNEEDFPEFFYSKKSIESHFIDRNSDPFYQELSNLIEKSIELLQDNSSEAQQTARLALKRGQDALDNIFEDDKLLRLLLKELTHQLNQKSEDIGTQRWRMEKESVKTDQEPYGLTNLLPIVE